MTCCQLLLASMCTPSQWHKLQPRLVDTGRGNFAWQICTLSSKAVRLDAVPPHKSQHKPTCSLLRAEGARLHEKKFILLLAGCTQSSVDAEANKAALPFQNNQTGYSYANTQYC